MAKAIISFLSFLLISNLCLCQQVIETAPDVLDSVNKIYTVVDQEAKFPGNIEAWKKFLMKNLKINEQINNGVPDGNYQVIISFTVDIHGKITDLNPQTKFGFGMEDEVIRMIKKGPDWEPAIWRGRKVNSIKRQRVTFFYATK